jgi:beta-mannosidase
MRKRISLDGKWQVIGFDHGQGDCEAAQSARDAVAARVPGDVHADLMRAKVIEDPYLGDNQERSKWVTEKDWWYRREFVVPKGAIREKTELVFDGIDTYGTVWLNGVEVGSTDNMFRQHRFDVTDVIRPGEKNVVVVRVASTVKIIEARDPKQYFACFYVPRIFVRKAQCHFSWDWAPHLPAIGIWQSVWLESYDSGRLTDVCVRTRCDGAITFLVETDQRRLRQDLDGREHRGKKVETYVPPDQIVVEITGHGQRYRGSVTSRGHHNHLTIFMKKPRLWWPAGMGEQNLYDYQVSLVRDGKVRDRVTGRFGVREVELIEEPRAEGGPARRSFSEGGFTFRFRVNGEDVFCKGANWVPADCFPGTVTDDKYRYLIRLAREANFNMLRIWGGGIYERDIFYDLCDEQGIMVWQDFMFACADYPDDEPGFVEAVMPEIEYQVRRLRNHPSIVYWCGGNEKTGSAGFKIHYGEKIFHIIIPGICRDLDPTRPYHAASPYSMTDLGNDPDSGDTHGGCYEHAFKRGIEHFREEIAKINTVFHSEFGLHGPTLHRTLKRFLPADRREPPNPIWELHVQDNPYNDLAETFSEVQLKVAERLFGPFRGVREFIKRGTTAHAEILREEMEHHRRRKYDNAGVMFWMFDDTWPCGSWSVVDYYGLPKPVYYHAKRACAPVMLSFQPGDGGYQVFATSDLRRPLEATLTYGRGSVGEAAVWSRSKHVKLAADCSAAVARILASQIPPDPGVYLFARLRGGGADVTATFFPRLWREVEWPEPELRWQVVSQEDRVAVVELRTKRYARGVNLTAPGDDHAIFSDNFFDLMPGQRKRVTIETRRPLDPRRLRVDHWLTEWD